MQVQGNEKVYTGVWQGVRHMWRADGVRGLFKGNGLNCIRIIPNSAIKFLTYEQLSRKVGDAAHARRPAWRWPPHLPAGGEEAASPGAVAASSPCCVPKACASQPCWMFQQFSG